MTDVTHEGSLEQVVSEQDFIPLLSAASKGFHSLSGDLVLAALTPWSKRQLFLLYTEADELESFLDDYGARTNQAYAVMTELVASVRGFALAGLSLEHLVRRIDGYGALARLPEDERSSAREDLAAARTFSQETLLAFLGALQDEAKRLGVSLPRAESREAPIALEPVRIRLPHDLGLQGLEEEEQRIAEVSAKYLQACAMLEEAGLRREDDPKVRARLLKERCSEESARVYEATVHNLQSAYDTYIKNTVLEAEDERLVQLRGHISATLHVLEAVTQLTHFVERHESDVRDLAARERLGELVPREAVHQVILNQLLFWADRLLQQGSGLAEELLPSYTNLQSLAVELGAGLVVHARPASMIVSIVNHHGTPVELELEGQTCNAASILELMVLIGSYPEARHFLFRGDEHPLRDIGVLFEHGLGEYGAASLPGSLDYLRGL
jgi:phosphotransferase system HPr (HPr) family protein